MPGSVGWPTSVDSSGLAVDEREGVTDEDDDGERDRWRWRSGASVNPASPEVVNRGYKDEPVFCDSVVSEDGNGLIDFTGFSSRCSGLWSSGRVFNWVMCRIDFWVKSRGAIWAIGADPRVGLT
jgi:hypothetical protein